MMNSEKMFEIIKSLAMGMEHGTIAELEDVSIAEVQAISVDCMDAILDAKAYQKQKGCD